MCGRRRTLGCDEACGWKSPHEQAVAERSRPRVLLETPDPGDAFACWRILERNGYEVSWCPGPDGSPPGTCPLVTSGQCALAGDADVIVSSLGLRRSSARCVLGALRRRLPDTPVIVAATASASHQWVPLLAGRRTLRLPMTAPALLASVEEAVAGTR